MSAVDVAIILALNCGLLALAGRAIGLTRGRSSRHDIAFHLLLLIAALRLLGGSEVRISFYGETRVTGRVFEFAA